MAICQKGRDFTSMKLNFVKMHGCGNDYIFFDCLEADIPKPQELSRRLSDRHKGIGGDGIVLILPSLTADAKMRMFNADGSEGSMCGNAIRCVAKYLYENDIVLNDHMTIETISGIRKLDLVLDGGVVCLVKVDMGQPKLNPKDIPINLPGESIIAQEIDVGDTKYKITCISMGNPHAVVFCDDISGLNLQQIGSLFEHNPLFPQRVNAEFVEIIGKNRLKMRVWERGSGETQACGTGACAAAVAAVLNSFCDEGKDISVELLGGILTIQYIDNIVYMTGDCIKVFEGVVDL